MKNYAIVEDGIVVNVAVGDDEWASSYEGLVVEYTEENPAYIGGDYSEGFFYRPRPYASWVKSDGDWLPPTPMPEDVDGDHAWIWNETAVDWELIEIPAES